MLFQNCSTVPIEAVLETATINKTVVSCKSLYLSSDLNSDSRYHCFLHLRPAVSRCLHDPRPQLLLGPLIGPCYLESATTLLVGVGVLDSSSPVSRSYICSTDSLLSVCLTTGRGTRYEIDADRCPQGLLFGFLAQYHECKSDTEGLHRANHRQNQNLPARSQSLVSETVASP